MESMAGSMENNPKQGAVHIIGDSKDSNSTDRLCSLEKYFSIILPCECVETQRQTRAEPSCPLGTTRCIPQAKFHQKPYNKSFIDQVCSVKMVGYWPRSFFASLWTSTSSRSINTQKKERGQYPAILTSRLVNNPYVYENGISDNVASRNR